MHGLQSWEPEAVHLLEPVRDAVIRGECQADRVRARYDGNPFTALHQTRLI